MKNILFTAIILFNLKTFATSYDNQLWLNLVAQGLITTESKIGAYIELQPRYSDKQKRNFEYLIRPAIYYKTDDYGAYHLGYLSRSNSEEKEIEKRYWAQWSKPFSLDNYTFTTRLRYEIRNLSLTKNSNRLRVMGRLLHNEFLFSDLKPFVSVELFFNLNDVNPSIKSGMKQSRSFIGLSQKMAESYTLEYSYMKNYVDSATTEDQDNNVLMVSLVKDF